MATRQLLPLHLPVDFAGQIVFWSVADKRFRRLCNVLSRLLADLEAALCTDFREAHPLVAEGSQTLVDADVVLGFGLLRFRTPLTRW